MAADGTQHTIIERATLEVGDVPAVEPGGDSEEAEYEIVYSVDEMIDTSKQYVLASTGTLWSYGTFETEPENKLDRSAISLNTRYSGTPGSVVSANGHYTTDFIPVDMTLADPLVMRISPASAIASPNGGCKIILIDADKASLQTTYLLNDATINTTGVAHNAIISNGDYLINLGYVRTERNEPSKYEKYDQIKYIRICDERSTSALTLDKIPEYTITFDAEAHIEYRWYDTGHKAEAGNGNYADLLVKVDQATADAAEAKDLAAEAKDLAVEAKTQIVTTDGTSNAYIATVPGITELKAGVSFIMLPNTAPMGSSVTLDVNNLGAKSLKRATSNGGVVDGSGQAWLSVGKPLNVIYNGTYWVIQNMAQPVATDLSGTLAVGKGGTGKTSYADTKYTSVRYRGTALYNTDTDPTTNGVINWTYK
jgi:hypothetical protein